MTKINRSAYFRTLAMAGVALLLAGASIVVPSALSSRKDVEKKLDEKLNRRVRKLIETSNYYTEVSMAEAVDDIDAYYSEAAIYNYLMNAIQYDEETTPITKFNVGTEMVYVPVETFSSVDPEDYIEPDGEMDNLEKMTYIDDDDNTRLYIWNDWLFMKEKGLYYAAQSIASPGMGNASDSFGAQNLYSQRNTEMNEVAQDLLKNGDPKGWYQEYRYCTWTFFKGMNEGDEEVVSIEQLPYKELSEEEKAAMNAKYGYSMLASYIIFEDGSELLGNWRSGTIRTSLVAFAVWAVLMLAIALILNKFMKPYTKEGTIWVEVGPDGTPVDPDVFDSGKNGEEGTAYMEGGSSEGKIPESLTEELLSFVAQSESSMGPNGYLDQMRDLIEKRKIASVEDMKGGEDQ